MYFTDQSKKAFQVWHIVRTSLVCGYCVQIIATTFQFKPTGIAAPARCFVSHLWKGKQIFKKLTSVTLYSAVEWNPTFTSCPWFYSAQAFMTNYVISLGSLLRNVTRLNIKVLVGMTGFRNSVLHGVAKHNVLRQPKHYRASININTICQGRSTWITHILNKRVVMICIENSFNTANEEKWNDLKEIVAIMETDGPDCKMCNIFDCINNCKCQNMSNI